MYLIQLDLKDESKELLLIHNNGHFREAYVI